MKSEEIQKQVDTMVAAKEQLDSIGTGDPNLDFGKYRKAVEAVSELLDDYDTRVSPPASRSIYC